MSPFHPRSIPAALLVLTLAGCGATPESAAAESTAAAPDAPATATPAPAAGSAPAPAAATDAGASAQGAAPAGYYECYFHGDYGLQNSSMTSIRIQGPAEYEAMDERGRYAESDGTLRMETGPLAGRVAQMRESSGKPAIVFIRKENEVDGRPTIDISDTWCYFEPR
ncbi:MAG TPA: hypothetical protein VF142_19670 [Longimicrobium sp.]